MSNEFKRVFDELAKYNPYHDAKGRFSASHGARTVINQGGVGSHSTINALADRHGAEVLERGKLTPFDTAGVIVERQHIKSLGVGNTNKIQTKEREELRDRVAGNLYREAHKNFGDGTVQNRQAYIVMGTPASGKSSAMAEPLAKKYQAMIIDSDDAKKRLPEFRGGKGAGAVHDESSNIAQRVRERAMKNGDNMVLPVVGKTEKSIEQYRDALKKNGYDVHLVLVEVSPQETVKRAIARWQHTGRFVDPDYVWNEVGMKPTTVYQKLKTEGFASYAHYDNNVPRGTPARLVQSSDPLKPPK